VRERWASACDLAAPYDVGKRLETGAPPWPTYQLVQTRLDLSLVFSDWTIFVRRMRLRPPSKPNDDVSESHQAPSTALATTAQI